MCGKWIFFGFGIQMLWKLKSGHVWISNDCKEVNLQMVQIWNGIWDPEAQPFEIWTRFCQKPFEIWSTILNDSGIRMVGFQTVSTIQVISWKLGILVHYSVPLCSCIFIWKLIPIICNKTMHRNKEENKKDKICNL